MYPSSILTTLFALGLTTALPHHNRRQAAIPTATDITCAQSAILAQGIALNIADQQQELATANTMAALLQANPLDTAAWAQSRTALLQFVNNGIAIRQANQLITPAQNPSEAGVATVANAQLTELGLATNLTVMGADNVPGNLAIVKTLQMDFSGGIVQNQKNMADVSSPIAPFALFFMLARHRSVLTIPFQAMVGCGSVGAAAAPAPAPAAAPPPAGMPAPAPPSPQPPAPKPSSSATAASVNIGGGGDAASEASAQRAEARGAARLGLVGTGAAFSM